jgi:hypothetical protein
MRWTIWLAWFAWFAGSITAYAQATNDYRSFQDGPWNDVNTWERFDGSVWVNPAPSTPTSAVGVITIQAGHTVTIPAGFSVTIDQTVIQASATLQVDATGTVTIANGTGNDLTINTGSVLNVSGTLVLNNGSVISGSTATTTAFQDGSVYEHQYTTTQGSIPLATWDAGSTLQITGYTAGITASAAGNWGQNFGNVVWNCASQTGTFLLSGLLTSVQGNFTVSATGTTGILRFISTGTGTLNVGGNFSVSGNTRLSFCTTGSFTVNISGNYTQNLSAGYVRFADGNNGTGTINITGDFNLLAGTLTENGGGTAQGNINFVGSAGTIHTYSEAGTPTTTLSNRLSYSVADENELIVSGESQLAGGGTSFFTLGIDAILRVQSTDATGAIQTGTGQATTTGNIRVGTRTYSSGGQVIYNGSGAQFMGTGQPTVANITTIIDNTSGVTQVAATTLALSGNLTISTGDLTVSNASLSIGGTTDLQGGDILFTSAGTARTLTFNGDVVFGGNLIVTSGTANANVIFSSDVTGGGTVSFSGLNSNLTINGIGDVEIPLAGTTSLETLACNRTGTLTFNQNLNVNTNAGASAFTISAGTVEVNGDVNGRNITLTGASNLVINGNTSLSNTFTVTNGTAQINGTLDISNDLVITTGSLEANGDVTLTDDLTLGTGAIFYFEDQTVTLNSQLNNPVGSPGFFSANSNSVLNILNTGTFTGDGTTNILAFTPTGNTLGSFVLNRPTGGTLVAINSTLTVENTFDLLDGDFSNISGLAFGNGAVVTRNSAAAFVGGSAVPTGGPYDLIYTGGSLTTGVEAQGSLNDITSNVTGTVTVSTPITATGDLTVNSGTFTCGANAVSVARYTHSGTTFNAPSTTLTLTGDFTNNGTFNSNNGTVVFNGATTISGTVNPTFRNIQIDGTLSPPLTLNLTGDFTNNGTFVPGSGTVVFTNTANGTKTISGSSTTTFNNLTIQNNTATTDVSISGTVDLTGVLTLNTDAVLDADGPGSGVLTLISSADDPTVDASVGPLTGSAAVTGNVTVQRYMAIEGPPATNNRIYRYISSPVQNATVADIQNEIPVTGGFTGSSTCSGCLTNPSMFSYNEAVTTGGINGGYEAFPVSSNTEQLVPGRGYAIFVRGNVDPVVSAGSALFDVRGPINSGTISLGNPSGLTFTSSGVLADDGWNLVGNPFPSTIDWNAATGWVRPAALDATIYIRNNGSNPQTYATWNGVTGTNGGSRYIAMGQGFWVKLNNTPSPATLSANENVKVAGQQTTFFRNGSPDDLLRITLKNGSKSDETVIHFREDATDAFDSHADAWKLANATINLASLNPANEKLAINSLAPFNCSGEVNLDISNVVPGNYLFEFSEFESFGEAVSISLIDNFTGTVKDVRTGPYNFQVTSAPQSYGSNRFKVQFAAPEIQSDFIVQSATVCQGPSGSLTIENTQNGVSYQARFNGQPISEVGYGDGSSLELALNTVNMPTGSNSIIIEAFISGCKVEKPHILEVASTDNLTGTEGGEACQSGSVVLTAIGVPAGTSVLWYESADSSTPVGTGTEFITPVLTETKSYYASVRNDAGCESVRTPVIATIHHYEPAEVSVIEGTHVLRSNYAEGNQWYRNNVIIPGANGQELLATQSGVYKVVVQIASCETTAEMPLIITATEESTGSGGSFNAYPNPTAGWVLLRSDKDYPINVLDSKGLLVGSVKLVPNGAEGFTGIFDLRAFPSGLYIFKVVGGSRKPTLKIYKN